VFFIIFDIVSQQIFCRRSCL